MRTYNVLIRRRGNADLKTFQIAAESLLDANELAVEVVANLSSEVIGKFSGDGCDQDVGLEILDVYEAYDDPALRLWTRD